jgi:outer membrane protein OmpA-like peptidoglycan-associated protein
MKKPTKRDDTIFFIGAIAFICILIVGIGTLIATGKIDLKSKFSGIGSAISTKKTEMTDQAKAGVTQMKAQIAKAVSGNTLTATVSFKLNETGLEASQHKLLEPIRELCMGNQATKITIQGYADSSGNALKNIALSVDRTKTVKSYFEYYGCHNIENGGYGSTIPERQVVVTATN